MFVCGFQDSCNVGPDPFAPTFPRRGPGGGKAWNSQITIVGVRCLDLAASVAPPKRLQDIGTARFRVQGLGFRV